MPRIGYRLLAACLALTLLGAGELPAALRRGVNITHWFRFPPSGNPAALRAYLDDAALEDLRIAGFTFVRLPVTSDLLADPGALVDAVARIHRHDLAVVVALFTTGWHLENDRADRARLLATWRSLASVLRRFPAATTFPEVMNEPVFINDDGTWAQLQHQAVLAIRRALPTSTIVLTGARWGGITGLLSVHREPDPNVIYSFHIYEPPELTALGAYRTDIDTAAMARLPFPVADPATCKAVANASHHLPTADLMRFYCAQHWDVTKLTTRIAEAGAWGQRHQVPVLAGEFGASEKLNGPARLAWLAAVRAACEQQQIGWALWGYDDSMGFGIQPSGDRRPLDPNILRALGLTR